MITISNDPYIYYIDNFLSNDECDFLINNSKDYLKLAGVSHMNNEKEKEKFKILRQNFVKRKILYQIER